MRVSLVKRYSEVWFNYSTYRRQYDFAMDCWQYETRIVVYEYVSHEVVESVLPVALDRVVREGLANKLRALADQTEVDGV